MEIPSEFTSPIIDDEVIAGLRELGDDDPEFFQDLVEQFIGDAQTHLQNIESAIENDDGQLLESAAHTFKSAAGNMGAARLAEICNVMQALGREGDTANARPLHQPLNDAYEAAVITLQS